MAKNLVYGDAARKALQTGVDKLANTVNPPASASL